MAFGFSFTFMAICVWQNMNLVTVEDSYLSVKYKSTYGWLKGEREDENEDSKSASGSGDQHNNGGSYQPPGMPDTSSY